MYACTYVLKYLVSQLGLTSSSEIGFGVDILMEINLYTLTHFTFVDDNGLGSPSSPAEATE